MKRFYFSYRGKTVWKTAPEVTAAAGADLDDDTEEDGVKITKRFAVAALHELHRQVPATAQVDTQVEGLVAQLEDEDAGVRYWSMATLASLSAKYLFDHCDKIAARLKDVDSGVRVYAAIAMRVLAAECDEDHDGPLDYLNELQEALEDSDPQVRIEATKVLAAMLEAESLEEVAKTHMKHLNDRRFPIFRASAAESIGYLGDAGLVLVGSLQGALSDRYPRVREAAAKALGNLGYQATGQLLEFDHPPRGGTKKEAEGGEGEGEGELEGEGEAAEEGEEGAEGKGEEGEGKEEGKSEDKAEGEEESDEEDEEDEEAKEEQRRKEEEEERKRKEEEEAVDEEDKPGYMIHRVKEELAKVGIEVEDFQEHCEVQDRDGKALLEDGATIPLSSIEDIPEAAFPVTLFLKDQNFAMTKACVALADLALSDPEVYVRNAADIALKQMNLTEALEHEKGSYRAWAAQMVATNPKAISSHIKRLGELLQDEDDKVRYWSATAVGDAGDKGLQFLPTLLKMAVQDADPEVRVAATKACVKLDQAAAKELGPEIAPTLKHKAVAFRKGAADSLGALGADAVPEAPGLNQALLDEDASVRLAAVYAITKAGKQGARACGPNLGKCSRTDEDHDVKKWSAFVLHEFGLAARYGAPARKGVAAAPE